MSATHSSKTTAASVDRTEDLPSSSFAEVGSVSLGDEEDAEEEDDIPDDNDEPEEDISEGEEWQDGPSRARTNRGPRLPSRSDVFEIPSSRGQKRYREELLFHIEKIQKRMEESARDQAELSKLLKDRLRTNPVQNTRSDGRVEALEGRVKALEDKVDALETEVTEMRWENSALEANVKLLMEERTRRIIDKKPNTQNIP
ncbi:hypothetical protein KEM56_003102 [Ascosphaera pollenicola]|nr:hypothetical protein KEM56_003102 [Ascosphaera pollenicola]